MLLLLFKIGQGHFALTASQVRKVVPRVALTRIPSAPDFAVGLMNYRGSLIPVLDLCLLATGKPSALKISTRIILVDYTLADGRSDILGLLAEDVVETVTCTQPLLPSAGVKLADLQGRPATMLQANDVIQLFDLHRTLPIQEVNALFVHLREAKISEQPEFDLVT
jgi:chemotaxis-related protein WspB